MSHTIVDHRNANPMWVYERNFALLTGLLPALSKEAGGPALFRAEGERLTISLLEEHKYTALIGLQYSLSREGRLLPDLHMTIRIYYDARLAEVLTYQGLRRMLSEYASGGLIYRDEKRQANVLLYELLTSLLATQRRHPDPIADH